MSDPGLEGENDAYTTGLERRLRDLEAALRLTVEWLEGIALYDDPVVAANNYPAPHPESQHAPVEEKLAELRALLGEEG
jgi:hypothetical protein